MSEALNELTDIKVKETSLVDRAANRREFLVMKRGRHGDGTEWSGKINPLLANDPELAALDKADQVAVAEGNSDMSKNNEADGAVKVVDTATVKTEAVVAPVVETPAVVAPVVKTPEVELAATTTTVVEAVTVKTEAVAVDANKVGAGDTQDKKVSKEDNENAPLKIQPGLRAALLGGLNAIMERAEAAKKVIDASVADLAGCSFIPWEAWPSVRMIDAIADRLLGDDGVEIGGVDFEVDAIMAGAALDGVTKAGAAMAAHRLAKFTSVHGDMGSAFKSMQACHKKMGEMLDALKKPVEKEDETPAAPAAPAAPATPAAVVKSEPITPSNAEKNIEVLTKAFTDLQKTVAAQAALLEKARQPGLSNAISVEGTTGGGGTINSDVAWPSDMGAKPTRRTGRF